MTGRGPAELTGSLLAHDRYSAGGPVRGDRETDAPPAPRVDPGHRQALADSGTSGPALGWRNAILFGAISGLALAVAVVAGSLLSDNPAPRGPAANETAVAAVPPLAAGKPLLLPQRDTTRHRAVPKPAAKPAVTRKAAARSKPSTRAAPPPPPLPPANHRPAAKTGSGKITPAAPPLPPGAGLRARPKPAPMKKLVAIPDPSVMDPQSFKPTTRLPRLRAVTKTPPIPPLGRRKPTIQTTAFAIQLSSLRSNSAAKREVSRLQRRFRSLLDGRKFRIRPTRIKGATVYRVHVDGFSGRAPARKLCKHMRASRQSCLVVRP